jgi:uncharacterized protein YneF (UPF0154 family)
MTNGAQPPARQGLPVWAWVGIGCGAVLILVLVVVMVGGFFVARKVQDVAADFEKDPAMATARMIVKLNPELEEVDVDEEAGTITVRNTKTGEIITVDFEDIEQGKFSFKSGDREITVDASEAGETGTVKITDGEDNVVFSAGKASTSEIPDWVPVYAGSEPTNRHAATTSTTVSGGFELETTDPVDQVLEFYRSTLEAAGYGVTVNTFSQEDGQGGMVNAAHEEDQRSVVAILNAEAGGPTKVVVNYNQGS